MSHYEFWQAPHPEFRKYAFVLEVGFQAAARAEPCPRDMRWWWTITDAAHRKCGCRT